jgi:Xaa-Pro aminopeptidase
MIKDQKYFAERRKAVFEAMTENSIAIIQSAPEKMRNTYLSYNYRQDGDFYYLTGFEEPEAIAVLEKTKNGNKYTLFNRPFNHDEELWTGPREGQIGAVKNLGADEGLNINELNNYLQKMLSNKERLYYSFGRYPEFDTIIFSTIKSMRNLYRTGVYPPEEVINIGFLLSEMRLIKKPEEIALMIHSAKINVEAHMQVMKICKPGLYEYDIESEIERVYYKNNTKQPAFEMIVASGKNTRYLHYSSVGNKLNDGDLILIDAGCEYNYYSSDITRTFPINGKFSPEQKAIYEIVLNAQQSVIDIIKPGILFEELQNKAIRVLTEGLVDIGILKGSVDKLIEEKEFTKFYMHRVSHWLGIDCHDMSRYWENGKSRTLKAGMTFSVEPGLYMWPTPELDNKWLGIGIRIEDEALVTDTGCEILTKDLPKTVSDIEHFMTDN